MKKFNLKKGLDIPVLGIPKQVIDETKIPRSVAIVGPEYNGLKPKMLINVGDQVKRGTPLFLSQRSARYSLCFSLQG